METLTIIVNDPPYGTERVWNALRLASSLVSAAVGMSVNIFLLGDAVSAAKKRQKTPEGYYNLEQMLIDLLKRGARVSACGTCIQARGLAKEDVIEGVEIGSMLGLAQWIKESQKVLSF
ncbi:MAG TPA: DsrE family protein [Candidatus Bathyarchaeia archaeon]|nr:DsrE family protein [Candidatus Bathyarchaeia archaeon]